MTYGHALSLVGACPRRGCDRPAYVRSEAADGALLCARHALDALTAQEAPPMTTNLTTPVRAHTLADKVALVEQYGPDFTDWRIAVDPAADGWLLEWHTLTLVVTELGDLNLAKFVALERGRARKALRLIVLRVVDDLGLPRGRFLHPARIKVNAGLTRCPGCGANVRAGQHAPGSQDCRDTRYERDLSHRDE